MPLATLLGVTASTPNMASYQAVNALDRLVSSREVKGLNAVELSVASKWPSVSLALSKRLLTGINQFNLQTRKSQASAERQFLDAQAGEAERSLREAENRLQAFLQQNRATASPELSFIRDRLQREVSLRQQMYTTLLQNREEARMREIRDTPVITVLEEPRIAVLPQPRRSMLKAIIGALLGGMFGALLAVLQQTFDTSRRQPTEEAREFSDLLADATPRFMRRTR
jgi:uncharacterized protein involved in exopolysaccharide biosynthesis